jgi:hypothetical protein
MGRRFLKGSKMARCGALDECQSVVIAAAVGSCSGINYSILIKGGWFNLDWCNTDRD